MKHFKVVLNTDILSFICDDCAKGTVTKCFLETFGSFNKNLANNNKR